MLRWREAIVRRCREAIRFGMNHEGRLTLPIRLVTLVLEQETRCFDATVDAEVLPCGRQSLMHRDRRPTDAPRDVLHLEPCMEQSKAFLLAFGQAFESGCIHSGGIADPMSR